MKDDPFDDVQRIVLAGTRWEYARHLVLSFNERSVPRYFLHQLMAKHPPTRAAFPWTPSPALQLSLGFSRRGLEGVSVPFHALACFAAKAPAFTAGAALRAASHAGGYGRNAPGHWDPAFDFMRLDAVLSLHAKGRKPLAAALCAIRSIARQAKVRITTLPKAHRLPACGNKQLVHFGYRDSLSRIDIQGRPRSAEAPECKPISIHAAGEFLLGHPQDSGANPWLTSPSQQVLPEKLRAFFRNGSFGVLQQIEQDVAEFEAFVVASAEAEGFSVDEVKAKLCGRTPEGLPLAQEPGKSPEDDFDYKTDPEGKSCPFGSHVRRMNPRGGALAHARSRPLLRRGMPYGPVWEHPPENKERGLIGQFFCASIEDQFEHLLGQWADRVPLGSEDGGGARDPLIGAHEAGDGGFEIPTAEGKTLVLSGLRAFTRTRGTAYLYYPSLTTLGKIAENDIFADLPEDDE